MLNFKITTEVKETVTSILGGEVITFITIFKTVSLGNFVLVSAETFVLAILGGIGGLLGKSLFNWVKKKLFK